MLTTLYMQQLVEESKKRPRDTFSDTPETTINNCFNPTDEPETKKRPSPCSVTLTTTETLGDSDEETSPVVSDKRKKQYFSSLFKSNPLENNDAIVEWIINNKRFLIASFKDQINSWIANKIKTDSTFENYKITVNLFTTAFSASLNDPNVIDVRKVGLVEGAQEFSSAHACFVDAVNGLSDDLGRSPDILSNTNNNLLRQFLSTNSIIADCLAYGLPVLNEVAAIWASEHQLQNLSPAVDLSPMKPSAKEKSQAKSPKKPVKSGKLLSVAEANALWKEKVTKLNNDSSMKESNKIDNLTPVTDSADVLNKHKTEQSSELSPKKSPVSKRVSDQNNPSPGELVAGSMTSLLNLSSHSGSPRKVAISLSGPRFAQTVISESKLDPAKPDDAGNDKQPSILRRRPKFSK